MQDNFYTHALIDGNYIPVTVFELDRDAGQAGVTAIQGQPFIHWVGGYGYQPTAHAFISIDRLVHFAASVTNTVTQEAQV